MHTVHEVDALSEKMDLLMKKLEEHANFKKEREAIQHYASARAIKAKQWCEVCGGNHSGNDCPETKEVVNIINNNGNHPQGNGWTSRPYYQGNGGNGFNKFNSNNQPSLKDLVMSQTKINESMNNKLLANDKTLETLNAKMDDLASAIKNQYSFNKMLETQLAKLATSVSYFDQIKNSDKPKNVSSINAVTTRGGKSTRDPPYPNMTGKTTRKDKEDETDEELHSQDDNVKFHGRTGPHEYYDTNMLLPFPNKPRKPSIDEQFEKFVEVICRLYVHIPLLDAMQVPTYAKYLQDNLNNKRTLPTTEVVKLTEECSATILNQLLPKKKDPGCPTINCSIETQHFDHALCDLGESISIMPRVVFDKLNYTTLSHTPMCL